MARVDLAASRGAPPRHLVDIGRMAESVGLDFVSLSDHYHTRIDR